MYQVALEVLKVNGPLDLPCELLQALIDAGADINRTCHGATPLKWLCRRMNEENRERGKNLVKWLLEHGADPNVCDSYGESPLMAARTASVCRMLLRHGAKASLADRSGLTALHFAVDRGRDEIVPLLLEQEGVDSNARGFVWWNAVNVD